MIRIKHQRSNVPLCITIGIIIYTCTFTMIMLTIKPNSRKRLKGYNSRHNFGNNIETAAFSENLTHLVEDSNNTKFLIKSTLLLHNNHKILNLWPLVNEVSSDRILNQLEYKTDSNAWKTVLLYGTLSADDGNKLIFKDECSVKRCTFVKGEEYLHKADAVLFESYPPQKLQKSQRQIWIFYSLESPLPYMNGYNDPFPEYSFNLTATYRRDSVIPLPFGKFVSDPKNNSKASSNSPKLYFSRSLLKQKSRLVAWIASDCVTINGRMNYVKELQRHINVDIFGKCGKFSCGGQNEAKCPDILSKKYKFYLSFESSNCVDYITDEFFQYGLRNNVVPVVMGARPEDYAAVAPPNSYIHVDEFASPKDLAKYLLLLDKDTELYNQYFNWQSSGTFINTKIYCRLCSMIHAGSDYHFMYKKISHWWNKPGSCVIKPNNTDYASWRNLIRKNNHR